MRSLNARPKRQPNPARSSGPGRPITLYLGHEEIAYLAARSMREPSSGMTRPSLSFILRNIIADEIRRHPIPGGVR